MNTLDQIQGVEIQAVDGLVLELGNVADLTLGGASGGREDKRYQVA